MEPVPRCEHPARQRLDILATEPTMRGYESEWRTDYERRARVNIDRALERLEATPSGGPPVAP